MARRLRGGVVGRMASSSAHNIHKIRITLKREGCLERESLCSCLGFTGCRLLFYLREMPEVKELTFELGGKGKRRYTSHQLWGRSSGKRILYFDEHHPKLMKTIAEALPATIGRAMRTAITRHLHRLGLKIETIHEIYKLKHGTRLRAQSYQ